jgi:hypothetical protein
VIADLTADPDEPRAATLLPPPLHCAPRDGLAAADVNAGGFFIKEIWHRELALCWQTMALYTIFVCKAIRRASPKSRPLRSPDNGGLVAARRSDLTASLSLVDGIG